MKLKIKYPGKLPEDGTIPAHLLGNMWAQSWGNLLGIIEGIDPYPSLAPIDVTESLVEQVIQ
jgi:peptidyl-dipeptidase A